MLSVEFVDSNDGPPAPAVSLLDAWHRFNAAPGGADAAGGPRPTRREFTPFFLKPWLGNIDVYEVERAEKEEDWQFRMRLNGTEVVEITGEDWTGRTAQDIDRRFGFSLHNELLDVCRSRQPLAHHIRIFQKEHIAAYRLVLPIFSEDGDGRVAQVFLAVFALD